ncbi:uncharacterized protein LOC144157052 [Haemaphysalis longicornis]
MDSAHVWTLISGRKTGLGPPIRRTFRWGDVELAMEVDTGSPVCVVSRQVYDRHHAQWPRLQPPRIKLSCYSGQLPVLGELELPVRYKNVSVPCPLIVLDCAGPSLCGRDLIALLDKTGVPIGHLTAPDLTTSAEPSDNMLNRLLGEFEDVFSTDLGLIKGPPASLKLKEKATPKLCRQFTLVTDHQPLLGLLKPDRPTPPMAAARIQRWALFLGGYQYKLQHFPGKQLLAADALSRLPAPTVAEPVAEGDPPEYVLSLEALDEGIVTTHELQELTAKDTLLARVAEYILHGWPRTTSGMAPDLLPFFDRKMELSMAHRLVYWGNRVVIPRKAQERMLQLLHETHQGSSPMKAVARSLLWWPGMDREIQELSAQCVSCVENLPIPAAVPPALVTQLQREVAPAMYVFTVLPRCFQSASASSTRRLLNRKLTATLKRMRDVSILNAEALARRYGRGILSPERAAPAGAKYTFSRCVRCGAKGHERNHCLQYCSPS